MKKIKILLGLAVITLLCSCDTLMTDEELDIKGQWQTYRADVMREGRIVSDPVLRGNKMFRLISFNNNGACSVVKTGDAASDYQDELHEGRYSYDTSHVEIETDDDREVYYYSNKSKELYGESVYTNDDGTHIVIYMKKISNCHK